MNLNRESPDRFFQNEIEDVDRKEDQRDIEQYFNIMSRDKLLPKSLQLSMLEVVTAP